MTRRPRRSTRTETPVPYTALFRSRPAAADPRRCSLRRTAEPQYARRSPRTGAGVAADLGFPALCRLVPRDTALDDEAVALVETGRERPAHIVRQRDPEAQQVPLALRLLVVLVLEIGRAHV